MSASVVPYSIVNLVHSHRFVNTGSWIGYVGAAKKLMKAIMESRDSADDIGRMNDQGLVTDFLVCDYLNGIYARSETELKELVGSNLDSVFSRLQACKKDGLSFSLSLSLSLSFNLNGLKDSHVTPYM